MLCRGRIILCPAARSCMVRVEPYAHVPPFECVSGNRIGPYARAPAPSARVRKRRRLRASARAFRAPPLALSAPKQKHC